VHASHRGSEDEAEVIDTEAVRQQVVLRQYHVVIVVLQKVRVQTIARLA
jgi:hypothetical protein